MLWWRRWWRLREWTPWLRSRTGRRSGLAPCRQSSWPNGAWATPCSSNTNECTVVLKHRGGDKGATCGAPGLLDVTVTSLVRTPVRVEFRYRRPWEKDVEPWKTLRLVVNTVSGEKQTPLTK